MIDIQVEIERRLSVLVGLEVSGVSHAADMLTLHFGPLRQFRTRRGTLLEGGAWALHVQCGWHIDRAGKIFARQSDFQQSDEDTDRVVRKLNDLLVAPVPAVVQGVRTDAAGGVRITLSGGLTVVVTPHGVAGDEDWRFFAPGRDERHFVIDGGRIDPDSLT